MALQAQMNRPFIIPVFLPHHGCPHRCIFCNQKAITGRRNHQPSPTKLKAYIDDFLEFKTHHRHPVQIAFYGGNFLGLKPDYIKDVLTVATEFIVSGKVDSIRFSTRPDTIDGQRLKLLKPFPVDTVEIGAQSMDDSVLSAAHRGHTAADTEKAVVCLKQHRYNVGIQMMVGLPGDDDARALNTGRQITALEPDFVRIYPTVVLAASPLAEMYLQGEYTPWTLERCVALVKKLYLGFQNNQIAVVRMGLQSSEGLDKDASVLAGPYHPAFGHLVHSAIFLDKATAAVASAGNSYDQVTLKVHPRSISKVRGQNNQNVAILKQTFQIRSLRILADPAVPENSLAVMYQTPLQ